MVKNVENIGRDTLTSFRFGEMCLRVVASWKLRKKLSNQKVLDNSVTTTCHYVVVAGGWSKAPLSLTIEASDQRESCFR
jgi:hypothetical protein